MPASVIVVPVLALATLVGVGAQRTATALLLGLKGKPQMYVVIAGSATL